jgi:hypothetical protein
MLNNIEHVKELYANQTFPKKYPTPRAELLQVIAGMKAHVAIDDVRSNTSGLSLNDDSMLWFCHVQCGAFGGATYTAIEIGLLTGLPPLWIASLINLYGADWQNSALRLGIASAETRKRITSNDSFVVPVFGQLSTVGLLMHTHSLSRPSLMSVFTDPKLKTTFDLSKAFSLLVQAQAKSIWLRSSISSTRMRYELNLRPIKETLPSDSAPAAKKNKACKSSESETGVLDEDFSYGVL